MRIGVIIPALSANPEGVAAFTSWRLGRWAAEGTQIHVLPVERGVSTLECRFDVALAVPGILDKVREAEAVGCDAVMIDVYFDPGVRAAREIARIPVVGPVEASVACLLLLCERFSVISVIASEIPHQRELFRLLGVEHRVASIRSVETGVSGVIGRAPEELEDLFFATLRRVVEDDGAQAVVFGCTAVWNLAETLMARAERDLGQRVPVIEPSVAALKLAESLVVQRLAPSRDAFPRPTEKHRAP